MTRVSLSAPSASFCRLHTAAFVPKTRVGALGHSQGGSATVDTPFVAAPPGELALLVTKRWRRVANRKQLAALAHER